ncbi:hypothetical protein [Paracoccus aerius]|uniref:Uncharacterized protein n=1 Tax=Paracoccus aerius TaxID=1915382 RepID=A0ABS1SAV6_9RHOB|nr:hypothetical protein [Paracoccus aerius]MBL3675674.1 hypothetical protein [Paracoccus aerius]
MGDLEKESVWRRDLDHQEVGFAMDFHSEAAVGYEHILSLRAFGTRLELEQVHFSSKAAEEPGKSEQADIEENPV